MLKGSEVRAAHVQAGSSPWLVVATLVTTTLGFVAATFFGQRITSTVNEDAVSIATNASPAIEHLTQARGELVRIAVETASILSTSRSGPPADSTKLSEALTGLLEALHLYLQQPFYPHEEVTYAAVDRAVRSLADQTSALGSALASGRREAVAERVRTGELPAVDRVDKAIERLVVFNAEQGERMALGIAKRRREAQRVRVLLQLVTVFLGLLLTGVVVRGIRDYARLLAGARAATRARDDLLATVSHDLRNPLSAIAMTVKALRRGTPDEAIQKQSARIERATERMSRLIEDLLDAAKIEGGVLRVERELHDVGQLIASAEEMFRAIGEEKSIRVVSQPPSSATTVLCERHLILRVLSNLLGNAIKFSPRGGTISLKAECLGGEARLSVSDGGPGIPADHLPHVFDRYWRDKRGNSGGSGLGLYIAKGIVEAHGGRIWIDVLGTGTTVSFTLPLARTLDHEATGSPQSG